MIIFVISRPCGVEVRYRNSDAENEGTSSTTTMAKQKRNHDVSPAARRARARGKRGDGLLLSLMHQLLHQGDSREGGMGGDALSVGLGRTEPRPVSCK
jgi:hypothetical protein